MKHIETEENLNDKTQHDIRLKQKSKVRPEFDKVSVADASSFDAHFTEQEQESWSKLPLYKQSLGSSLKMSRETKADQAKKIDDFIKMEKERELEMEQEIKQMSDHRRNLILS